MEVAPGIEVWCQKCDPIKSLGESVAPEMLARQEFLAGMQSVIKNALDEAFPEERCKRCGGSKQITGWTATGYRPCPECVPPVKPHCKTCSCGKPGSEALR